jgi:hypothetical protein
MRQLSMARLGSDGVSMRCVTNVTVRTGSGIVVLSWKSKRESPARQSLRSRPSFLERDHRHNLTDHMVTRLPIWARIWHENTENSIFSHPNAALAKLMPRSGRKRPFSERVSRAVLGLHQQPAVIMSNLQKYFEGKIVCT